MQKQAGIIVAGLSALLLLGAGCSQQTAQVTPQANNVAVNQPQDTTPIKIGWLSPLTGDLAGVGTAIKNAVAMGVKEINAQGGINGRPLDIVYEDSACDPKVASAAGSKLINIEKVTAILGAGCTGETLAVAPMAEQNKVVMLSFASTGPAVTTAGDYIFRDVPSDSYVGKYTADFTFNTLGKKKAAILFSKADFTEQIANIFTDEFKKLGGEIVATESALQTDTDLRTQLTKIKNSGADVLFFPTYTENTLAGLKQAKDLNLSLPTLGIDGFDDPKVLSAVGAEGVMYPKPVSQENAEFKTKFLAENGGDSIPVYVTQGYDALNILVQTMKKVGTSGEAIKNELYNVKNYAGVSGNISFDKNGDLEKSEYEMMIIKDGKSLKYQAQ